MWSVLLVGDFGSISVWVRWNQLSFTGDGITCAKESVSRVIAARPTLTIAMNTSGHLRSIAPRIRVWAGGFSLVEAVMAMVIRGITVVALLSGVTSGMLTMRMARENLRATQIMVERT